MSGPGDCRLQLAPRRNGFTLIETVGVVVLIGMLLTLCAATLHRAYQVHHAALDTFQELEQLNFWCERLRADIHQSLSMELSADKPQDLILEQSDGRMVTYSLIQGQLVRDVKHGDVQVTEEALPAIQPAEISWTVERSGRYPLISLHLNFTSPRRARQPLTWTARLLNQPTTVVDEATSPTPKTVEDEATSPTPETVEDEATSPTPKP